MRVLTLSENVILCSQCIFRSLFKAINIIHCRWLDSPVAMTYPITIETSTFADGMEIEKQTFNYLISEHYAGTFMAILKMHRSFLVYVVCLSVIYKDYFGYRRL